MNAMVSLCVGLYVEWKCAMYLIREDILLGSYPRRLCRSAWVGRLRPSVCLFVCLSAA